MFKELDVIALTTEVPLDHIWDVPSSSPLIENRNPKEGLKAGDIGTIVYIQGNGEALEVEFLDPYGNTVAIATISPSQARPATKEDLTKRSLLEEAGGPAPSLPRDRIRKRKPLSVLEEPMNYNEQDIRVGALVQWTHRPKTYGVIAKIEDGRIHVRWDDENIPTQFVESDPPLTRVKLQGKTLQRLSTGEKASVLTPLQAEKPAWVCFVEGGETINVPEADLRPLLITNPVERFKEDEIGSLQQYRLQQVTRWYQTLHLYDDLISLGQVGVDIKPHQVSVVHKVVDNYPHRFLLCDEVGLGKTIEAGMILKELRARGGAQRVLVIVPPNLVRQWQFEMKTKFNESFAVLNRDTVQFLANQGNTDNPFTYENSILCSSGWVVNDKWAKACTEVDWDLIIVDEAHHARRHYSGDVTRLYRLVRDLAAPEHCARCGVLFLTATPMQLHPYELYSLIELLDPALFPSEDHFEQHRQEMPGLSQLVEHLNRHEFRLPAESRNRTSEKVANWLDSDVEVVRQRLSSGIEEQKKVANELADRHLLSEVLIRNRKNVVGGFMPRVANRWEVELTTEERVALQAVEEYVQYGFQLADLYSDRSAGFVMVIYQKMMASSIAAIRESLSRRREKILTGIGGSQSSIDDTELEERLDADEDAIDVAGYTGTAAMTKAELSLLHKAIESLEQVKSDSKSRVLVERLAELFDDSPDEEKVLVFTQFRETQRHLKDLLKDQGWGVNIFHGQMKPEEKDRAVERFKNDTGPQVLISTEAGGEGRNFQFCHLLVNYDLPWNPMKVEQRIGRVDRIGQEHTVNIFNLWAKDTIEERVLDVLENRIKVFEETVGGLDPILGETEDDIKKIMRLATEIQETALEELGKRVEDDVRRAREAEGQLGDFIMDTKSFRREIAERIAGQPSPITNDALDRFIGRLLSDKRTYIKRQGNIYELIFHNEFVETHSHLLPAGSKRKAVFRPDQRPDAEDVEFMTFGHPIVDAIVELVLSESYEGITGTRRIPAGDDLSPTSGWLFTYQFTAPGPRSIEHFVPVFISDAGEVDEETGLDLVRRACRFEDVEQKIKPADIPDNLDQISKLADQFINSKRETLQQQAESQATERVDREVARLEKWFDYRETSARGKVEATRSIVSRFRESDEEAHRRILPVWEDRLRRDEELLNNLPKERRRRIVESEKYRYPQVAWAPKSLGRIEVTAHSGE